MAFRQRLPLLLQKALRQVEIYDVTLRDGMQVSSPFLLPSCFVPTHHINSVILAPHKMLGMHTNF